MWNIAAFIGTTLGKVVLGVVGLVLTVGIAGGSLYAMDFGAEAEIIAKDCSVSGSSITAEERWTRFDVEQPIDLAKCSIVSEGNFVVYNIRSERLRVWEDASKVRLLWDSEWLGGGGGSGGGESEGGGFGLPIGVSTYALVPLVKSASRRTALSSK